MRPSFAIKEYNGEFLFDEKEQSMKRPLVLGMALMNLMLIGCTKEPSKPANTGVNVNVPGVNVQVDKGGVDVKAPGVNVTVPK